MPQLRVVGPEAREQVLELRGEEFVLGRDPDRADVHLQDKKVSRAHARLFRQGHGYFIEDLGSANGVLIGGRPIRKAVQLGPGSEFEIGPFLLTFEEDAPQETLAFSLVGLSGPADGRTYQLPVAELMVGRGEDCDIPLPDGSVSREHATLIVESDTLVVRDLRSRNGTYVNGERVAKEPLHNGDLLRIGNVEFEVLVEGGQARQPFVLPGKELWNRLRRADGSVKLALGMGAMTLVLLAVVVIILAVRSSGSSNGADPFVAYEQAVEVGLSAARAHYQKGAWQDAIRAYHDVLEQDPINEEARQGLYSAQTNQEHQTVVAAAKQALKRGKPQDALSRLGSIPGDAHYAKEAAEVAAQARVLVANRALGEARGACRRKDWKVCHQRSVIALTYQPELSEALGLIEQAEKEMSAKRVAFTPWAR